MSPLFEPHFEIASSPRNAPQGGRPGGSNLAAGRVSNVWFAPLALRRPRSTARRGRSIWTRPPFLSSPLIARLTGIEPETGQDLGALLLHRGQLVRIASTNISGLRLRPAGNRCRQLDSDHRVRRLQHASTELELWGNTAPSAVSSTGSGPATSPLVVVTESDHLRGGGRAPPYHPSGGTPGGGVSQPATSYVLQRPTLDVGCHRHARARPLSWQRARTASLLS